ncbi:hypothetical protein AK973_2690 [Pseudomonas brassicacearum]|nr:hypothetical protein AK973_2690 [Pseudomonas brassicacearum]
MIPSRHRQAGHRRHAEASLDQSQRRGQVLHFVKPLRAPAQARQCVVQQHAVAAQATNTDQPIITEFRPGNRTAFSQFMIAPAGQHKGFVDQGHELDVRVLAAHHVDAEVGFAAQNCFEPFVGAEVEQADADFRVALVVEADHRRQEIKRCRGNAGQSYPADLPLRQLADVENRVVEIIQQAPRLGQEITADARQADLAGGAIE